MSDTTETEHRVDMKESKPVAWIRYCSDGSFEGPIMDNLIEDVRKKSGEWTPLFATREKAMTDELSNSERVAHKKAEAQLVEYRRLSESGESLGGELEEKVRRMELEALLTAKDAEIREILKQAEETKLRIGEDV